MHHLAPGALLAISLLTHTRMIALWVRDRSRQRLNRAVLRELARTGGTVREERRTRGGTLLIWELRLPENRGETAQRSPAVRRPHAHRPRRRPCGSGTRVANRSSGTVEAGGGR
ncbi:hypothetical protein [Streptomyces phaeolivaceus]|uniref:hypothetical protein n=1 Tax=Streptomyces phaeolivaceus TaxID=2653200 RepID=UPI001869C817|nr:hypothetical protein [Streptomyces phaeolivaceus]